MSAVDLNALEAGETISQTSTWRDWLGITASIGCAIHCAAMPFVIAYLPALGLSFLADEAFHKWMALICFLIAIAAFVPGIRKHGNWIPMSIGGIGLVFITFAAFGLAGECCPSCEANATEGATVAAVGDEDTCENCEDCENCDAASGIVEVSHSDQTGVAEPDKKDLLSTLAPWITPFGGLLLVSAHLFNRRCGYVCSCCDESSCDTGDKTA